MQYLPETAAYWRRLEQGDYVANKLKRKKLADLLAAVIAATDLVEAKGLAWDRARRAAFAAQAERDGIDDDLDELAKDHRANRAGQSANAINEEPYTLVYHQGIEYYTKAAVNLQVTRYQELADRIREHMPADVAIAQQIEALLVEYEASVKALEKARRKVALARTALDSAQEAFDTTLERTHGTLQSRFNRRKANRFFPRYRSATPAIDPTVDEGALVVTES